MGFGFNLFLVFILLPLTAILAISWLLTRKKAFSKALGLLWLAVIGLVVISNVTKPLSAKKNLAKEDYYGWYVVDRKYFSGRQADWQYNSLRFNIKANDSIYFYLTNKEHILKTYRGRISTVKPYSSERLVIDMEQPTYHVLASNPTTYRDARGFCLVFHSTKFNNVYFKKEEWKPLAE
ncbi:MAG: hypothetical protein ACRYFZ_16485 [Janthinobacterium lividum]